MFSVSLNLVNVLVNVLVNLVDKFIPKSGVYMRLFGLDWADY